MYLLALLRLNVLIIENLSFSIKSRIRDKKAMFMLAIG